MIFSNGAILTPNAHKFLHTIEKYDINIYRGINKMFKLFIMQKSGPTLEQRYIMQEILRLFYQKFENEKTKKGKPIIKERYKNF